MKKPFYATDLGQYFIGSFEEVAQDQIDKYRGKIQLILTSPPFPLNRHKKYGNHKGEEYLEWFSSLAPIFSDLLTEDGSLVIEVGNSWEPGRPVQSLLTIKSLLSLVEHPSADLRLCQELVCYNPSRLPSPAQWVTIERIRLTDSYTQVWWLAKRDYPKADNSKVLRPYSKSMKSLLKRQNYNAGTRPSQHTISEKSFLKNHGGSIMPNVIELDKYDEDVDIRLPENLLRLSNTNSGDKYLQKCRENGERPHPARMQLSLASFFIEFLTEPGDLVLDPFAGSNTTGYIAEELKRKWIAIDKNETYARQSRYRFE